MEVELTHFQKAFVRQAIESGRLRREEGAVSETASFGVIGRLKAPVLKMAVGAGFQACRRASARRLGTGLRTRLFNS